MFLRRYLSRVFWIFDIENEVDFFLSFIFLINYEGYVFYIDLCLVVIYMAWKMNVRIEKIFLLNYLYIEF